MKRISIILLFILGGIQLLFGDKTIIAVSNFEAIGLEDNSASIVTELTTSYLAGKPMFSVVERGRIDAVILEQRTQMEAITDSETALKIGQILNAQKLLTGSIARYESTYIDFIVTMRIIDATTGAIDVSASAEVASGDTLKKDVEALIDSLLDSIELTGKVSKVVDDSVYISLGSMMGVEAGDAFGVKEISVIRDEKGNFLMREDRPVANLEVVESLEDGSRCIVLEMVSGTEIQQGMVVGTPIRNLPADESGRASIEITTIPAGVTVYINEEFSGATPITISDAEPGVYNLELAAAGFKTQQLELELGAGKQAVINREMVKEYTQDELLKQGKIPRKQTDPIIALQRSLIPGQGYAYNGYDQLAGIVPSIIAGTVTLGIAGGLMADGPFLNSISGNFLGAAIAGYLFSIIDSISSAVAPYRYPSYLWFQTRLIGSYTNFGQDFIYPEGFPTAWMAEDYYSETMDISNYEEFDNYYQNQQGYGGGMMIPVQYRGRKYELGVQLIILQQSDAQFALAFNIGYNIIRIGDFGLRIGSYGSGFFTSPEPPDMRGWGFERYIPNFGLRICPTLGFSIEKLNTFFRLDIAPVIYGEQTIVFPDQIYSGNVDDWITAEATDEEVTEFMYTRGMDTLSAATIGFGVELELARFFSGRNGFSVWGRLDYHPNDGERSYKELEAYIDLLTSYQVMAGISYVYRF